MRAEVSGVVRDRRGQPQIGAVVQLLNADYSLAAQTFTDDRGHYSLPRLGAGSYRLKASNPLFLPTVRPDLRLLANSRVIVNLTLSTLEQALQWLPAEPRTSSTAADDWTWTLRLSANRPLLRWLDTRTARLAEVGTLGGEPVVIENSEEPAGSRGARRLASRATMRSGSGAFGQGGTEQQVVWTAGDAEVRAFLLETHTRLGATGLEQFSSSAEYRQQLSPVHSVATAITWTERPGIRSAGRSGLATGHVRSASVTRFGDLGELSTGADLELARLGSGATVIGSHPFAELSAHAGQTTIAYQVATSPGAVGEESLEREASLDSPRLSALGGVLHFEQGLHQELQLRRQAGTWMGQVGVFEDSLRHPVIAGVVRGDEAAIDSENVLYDPGTGTIAVSGAGYSGGGVLAMLHDQLSASTWLTLRYAMGDALTADQVLPLAGTGGHTLPKAHSVASAAIAAGTRVAGTQTELRVSYAWQPVSTLTQVAPFDAEAPDAYLGLSVRQPLYLERAGSGRLEAVLDVRNLLAQGYQPFLSQDGTTVYFAQTRRAVVAGLRLSF